MTTAVSFVYEITTLYIDYKFMFDVDLINYLVHQLKQLIINVQLYLFTRQASLIIKKPIYI